MRVKHTWIEATNIVSPNWKSKEESGKNIERKNRISVDRRR